jgi:hypothetical protein
MPDERTARIAVGRTHTEAWLQQVKGKMAFVLLQQAHQECILGGRAVHDCAINDEQTIPIAVLDHVSIKVWTLHEPERFFVVFPLGMLSLYHVSSSCHRCNSPDSGWCLSRFVRLIAVCQKSISEKKVYQVIEPGNVFDELTPFYKIHVVECQSNDNLLEQVY